MLSSIKTRLHGANARVIRPLPATHHFPHTRTGKVVTNAMPEWTQSLDLIGHGIVYFTMFYCSMNWILYRNTRKDVENIVEERTKGKNKKHGK